jgi:uncharacterized protein (TIGR00661 family)
MKGALPRKNKEKCRVLVAPLDWGLGHATRCIPLIHTLVKAGAEVWLAGEGAQATLLGAEFPQLAMLPLKGYGVRYARSAGSMNWKILSQVLKIKKAIKAENAWLKKIQQEYSFDAVISDNRYGLHHPDIPSIIITHQLLIKTGLGFRTEKWLQKWNYKYLEKFNACWIPDLKENGLAGDLSHPARIPSIPVSYIGLLSRFTPLDIPFKKNKLLIILSGPEPQRSILEELVFRDIAHYPGEAIIVRGLPASRTHVPSTGMIQIYNHLDSNTLNREMNEADLVIARSGYSTIMDAFRLGKKCIFIPTPGQTEQEYLGKYLQEKNLALCVEQKSFQLTKALKAAGEFEYKHTQIENDFLDEMIAQWVNHASV